MEHSEIIATALARPGGRAVLRALADGQWHPQGDLQRLAAVPLESIRALLSDLEHRGVVLRRVIERGPDTYVQYQLHGHAGADLLAMLDDVGEGSAPGLEEVGVVYLTMVLSLRERLEIMGGPGMLSQVATAAARTVEKDPLQEELFQLWLDEPSADEARARLARIIRTHNLNEVQRVRDAFTALFRVLLHALEEQLGALYTKTMVRQSTKGLSQSDLQIVEQYGLLQGLNHGLFNV